MDLVFQSIAGTEPANSSFGVTVPMLLEANEAGRSLKRGTVGDNVMYLETGQGSALSAHAHLGTGGKPVDQQTLETRAYGLARALEPLLINTVVGFIGPGICTTVNKSSAPDSKIISAANSSACRWAWTSAIPITPRPTRTTWTPCSPCSGWPGRHS